MSINSMFEFESIKKISDDFETTFEKLNQLYTEFQGFTNETTFKITNEKLTFKNDLKEIIEFCNTWENVPNEILKSQKILKYLSNELVKYSKFDFQTKNKILLRIKEIKNGNSNKESNNNEKEISEIDKLKHQIELLNDTIKKQNETIAHQEQTIENLKNQINFSDSEINSGDNKEKKIREQNKLIKQLKDIIIRQDSKIKDLEKQKSDVCDQEEPQLSIYGIPIKKKTRPTSKDDIKNYEYKHSRLIEKLTTKNGNMYRLRVRDYKRFTNNNIEYLNDLNIEKNTNTNKYELTHLQVDKLIEKIILNDKDCWD